jgi:hypothetical protein
MSSTIFSLCIDTTQLREAHNEIELKYITQREVYKQEIIFFSYREDCDYVRDKFLTIYINKKTSEISLVVLSTRKIPKSPYNLASIKSWILYKSD